MEFHLQSLSLPSGPTCSRSAGGMYPFPENSLQAVFHPTRLTLIPVYVPPPHPLTMPFTPLHTICAVVQLACQHPQTSLWNSISLSSFESPLFCWNPSPTSKQPMCHLFHAAFPRAPSANIYPLPLKSRTLPGTCYTVARPVPHMLTTCP